ncbi:MAG: MFS transporter [Hyphomicrobiales bacterium]|nr:MAG: MFS transporter [Hyphomicrobiales bacterium]
MLMTAAMEMSFATWRALINNFAVERASFTGAEMGILQSIREIPGFLAFSAVFILLMMREQTLVLTSLLLLGVGTAITGFFPTEIGLYCTVLIMSIGFHYYETMNQSLSLQWLSKEEAPAALGKVLAVGSFAAIAAFGLISLLWKVLALDYDHIYLGGGGVTILLVLVMWLLFPHFQIKVEQRKKLVLRKRYWLYYLLTFMAGARRQIFVVFAGFLMVEKFGFSVAAITLLFLANNVFNMLFAAKIGRMIGQWGERRSLIFEYGGLIAVFVAYAFVDNAWIAAGLYILDHAFFAMRIAMKTYFQKIADPADFAPTSGVAFSINHIAAVLIPASFGLIWLVSPALVFLLGAGMSALSLVLAMLVPENPAEGNETVLGGPVSPVPAE